VLRPPDGAPEEQIPQGTATDACNGADQHKTQDIHAVPSCSQRAADRKYDITSVDDGKDVHV